MEAISCTLLVLVLFAALCSWLALRCDKPSPMPIYREAEAPIIPDADPPPAKQVAKAREIKLKVYGR